MVKALDGCGLNNRYWIFSAATTNVYYRLEVLDVKTGTKIYFNYPVRRLSAVTDTSALAVCRRFARESPSPYPLPRR